MSSVGWDYYEAPLTKAALTPQSRKSTSVRRRTQPLLRSTSPAPPSFIEVGQRREESSEPAASEIPESPGASLPRKFVAEERARQQRAEYQDFRFGVREYVSGLKNKLEDLLCVDEGGAPRRSPQRVETVPENSAQRTHHWLDVKASSLLQRHAALRELHPL